MKIGLLALALGSIATGALFSRGSGVHAIASYATSLVGRTADQRHNAVLALLRLDGKVIPAHGEFSFNRTVGTFSRDAGFRKAPVSYNGTLISSWGGGVCQASTTFYNAGLIAGLTVLERNRHRFMPSYVPPGRDAAVAFGNLDLRFRNTNNFPITIHARVEMERLQVTLTSEQEVAHSEILTEIQSVTEPRLYLVGSGTSSRVRNSGKAGFQVATLRVTSGKVALVSVDSYPVMNRVIEFR